METYIPIIPFWSMIAIGVLLMALEIITTTFVLFLFGLAFVLIGISEWLIDYPSGEIQLISTFVVGLALTALLSKTLRQRIYSSKPLQLETLTTGRNGQIIVTADGDYRVNYQGTTWAISNIDSLTVVNGQTVIVDALENNQAHISLVGNHND
ncbi:hypothetical protein THMIRHAS_24230 [Thiosulfatimonas sediminis]|uniref:NfeD-like C-terminal domain-containing protein n=1 Tax=Thiosulfatimonas sediminis TaxID=2675054 RepID=A0A6F8PYK8_9GAMM|nr:NfeD family protein [Thiosulfatimonas sediminis]BBP47050.1 hypothetical protein THMIRHAS_24230 [Thiosulfatimonas sediminis]